MEINWDEHILGLSVDEIEKLEHFELNIWVKAYLKRKGWD